MDRADRALAPPELFLYAGMGTGLVLYEVYIIKITLLMTVNEYLPCRICMRRQLHRNRVLLSNIIFNQWLYF